MRYEDFVIHLAAAPGGGYAVRVSSPLAGEGEGTFDVAIDPSQLDLLAADLARAVESHRGARHLVVDELEETAEPLLRTLGGRLFGALFAGPVRSRYDHCLGCLGEREDCGLRLKIQMGLDDPRLARLHSLPWEYLYRPEDQTFLALGRQTPVVRYVSLPLRGDRAPLPLPLRILVVVSEPQGLPPLELARERRSLEKAWAGRGSAEVTFLDRPTLDRLRDALLERKHHVLHFMGHGDFDRATGGGVLYLEDEAGKPLSVSGPALADQLRDVPSLRLVFLNACQTARAAASGPFAGVSTALLQAGVPAVIAMQFPIADEAAIAFGEAVYRRLVAGDPVDAAVAEGRLAIARRRPGSLEWGTPVLFLRTPDGRIFQTRERPVEPGIRPAPIRSRRSLGLAAAGLVLATGVAVIPLLSRGAEPLQPKGTGSQQAEERPTVPSSGPVGPVQEPRPERRSEPEEKKAPPPQRTVPSAQGTRIEDEFAFSRQGPRTYEVADGQTVFVPEVKTHVSVTFTDAAEYGEAFVRVSLAPEDSPAVQPAPFMGKTTLAYETAAGRCELDVTAIDWKGRGVTIRPRLTAS